MADEQQVQWPDGQHVRVGVAVLVQCPETGRVLVGRRKGSHGAGTYALPGGHLEMGESWEACARREVLEETGLRLDALSLAKVTNDVMEAERKHYVTVFMRGVASRGQPGPQLLEPDKCEAWEWLADLASVPLPRFIPLHNLIESGYALGGEQA